MTPKLCADRQRLPLAEDLADLLGQGAGGDVVVLRRNAQKLIAHAAAGPQRLISGGPEAANDVGGQIRGEHSGPGSGGSGFGVQSSGG